MLQHEPMINGAVCASLFGGRSSACMSMCGSFLVTCSTVAIAESRNDPGSHMSSFANSPHECTDEKGRGLLSKAYKLVSRFCQSKRSISQATGLSIMSSDMSALTLTPWAARLTASLTERILLQSSDLKCR